MTALELATGHSRRQFLTVAGAIGLAAVVAGCGSGTTANEPSTPATEGAATTGTTAGKSNAARTDNAVSTKTAATSRRMTMTSDFPTGVQVYGPDEGPAVLVLHPWWGISPGVLAWKDTLVGAGARVVLPDLYDGKVVDTIEEAEALSDAINGAAAFAVLDACAEQLNSSGEPWSALGWSLGAFFASQMMSRVENAPHRAVLFYGAAPPQGPSRTQAVQLHIAPGDQYFSDAEIAQALAGFEQAGIEVERFDYPGLGHWFAEVGSPAYDAEGTRVATERVLPFLGLAAG